jgi:hypothetical protein
MNQDFGLLLMVFALFGLLSLNIAMVRLMVLRNRRFIKIIRGMQTSADQT